MSANIAFPGDISVAWATPVCLAQFGARLFAYVGTKASLTALRLVIKNTAYRSLPEEIISLIAVEVREQVFQQKIEDWDYLSKCLAGSCTAPSFLSDAELNNLCSMAPVDWYEGGEKDVPSWLLDSIASERNIHNLKLMCHLLTDTRDTSALAKCCQIFAQDFGLRPYFKVCKIYHEDDGVLDCIEVKAYLTLPLLNTQALFDQGPGRVSFSVEKILNPTTLKGPTNVQLQRFAIASKILDVRPSDRDECETVAGNGPGVSKLSSSNSDPQLGEPDRDDGGESNGAQRDGQTWPQLMILGFGELKAGYTIDY